MRCRDVVFRSSNVKRAEQVRTKVNQGQGDEKREKNQSNDKHSMLFSTRSLYPLYIDLDLPHSRDETTQREPWGPSSLSLCLPAGCGSDDATRRRCVALRPARVQRATTNRNRNRDKPVPDPREIEQSLSVSLVIFLFCPVLSVRLARRRRTTTRARTWCVEWRAWLDGRTRKEFLKIPPRIANARRDKDHKKT